MLWTTESTVQFIDEMRCHRCLWDVSYPDYRNRESKSFALEFLASKFEVSVPEVEKKIHTLKGQFRREYKKRKNMKNGSLKCSWFGYEPMLFLLPMMESKGSRNTDEENLDEDQDSCNSENQLLYERDNPEAKEENPPPFKAPNLPCKRSQTDDLYALERPKVKRMKTQADFTTSFRDEYTVFGEYMAQKMRNCNRSRLEIALAQHNMHDIMFNLEMGMYADQVPPNLHHAQSSYHPKPSHSRCSDDSYDSDASPPPFVNPETVLQTPQNSDSPEQKPFVDVKPISLLKRTLQGE